MRPIKFRAWTGKVMRTDGAYAFILGKGGGFIREDDGWTFMQFTGLHDKNGKEIYEGDVVKYGGTNWEIGYMAPEFFLVRRKEQRHGRMDSRYWGDTEVIGNIYENPELLS